MQHDEATPDRDHSFSTVTTDVEDIIAHYFVTMLCAIALHWSFIVVTVPLQRRRIVLTSDRPYVYQHGRRCDPARSSAQLCARVRDHRQSIAGRYVDEREQSRTCIGLQRNDSASEP
jgi:hypothetical protein